MSRYPRFLLWVDLETTTLPKGNDFSGVHILEVGALLTGIKFPYDKFYSYHEVIAPTREAVESLRGNPMVLKMHKASGLIEDWKAAPPENTVAFAESEIMAMLESAEVEPQDVAIAGSGVAAFDFPLIKEKMPTLAKHLVYFSFDVGMYRRLTMSFLYDLKSTVPDTPASYGDGMKEHRAMADVVAHRDEAVAYGEWMRLLVPPF